MFLLPSKAMFEPDAAWVPRSRLAGLPDRQKDRYLPLCPDFVVELTSPSDRLPQVRKKMEQWMSNGTELGWILHPPKREVHVYGPSGIEVLHQPTEAPGDGPVARFVLDLTKIWDPGW